MTSPPPVTCYIAGALNKVPEDRREELSRKRKAIAKFLRNGYGITCSCYKVLEAKNEYDNPIEEDLQSIVAGDLSLINSAELFVLCYDGKDIYSWGAAIELGYANSCGKTIVIFNLSKGEDCSFLEKYLPQPKTKVYIIADEESLKDFTDKYQCDMTKITMGKNALTEAHKELDIFSSADSQKDSAPDYTLKSVTTDTLFALEYKGKERHSWEAAIKLGHEYGSRKAIATFNMSMKNIYFFIRYLPQDDEHKVYIITDGKSLEDFKKDNPQVDPDVQDMVDRFENRQ